ncbi:MAG: YbaK/EbsC family protein [Sciscionella sp.]
MGTLDHPGVAKVAAALDEAGMHSAAAGIRVLESDVRTAAQAAQAVGVEVGAIANSLVFRAVLGTMPQALLVLTSGAHRASTRRLRELTGADGISKADANFVRKHTGQVIGGVGPVGHAEPIRTVVDTALARYPVVWAAAGHPKAVFPTTFADLLALTGGSQAEVAEPEDDRGV